MIFGLTLDGENISEEIPFTLPIPDLMYNYYFGTDTLKIGPGIRVWSVIVFTGAYPIISAELELDRFIFNANIGGGAFAYTSVAGSGFETGKVFLPEVSAAFRLTSWFSLGVSILGVYVPEVTDDEFGYFINILGRFRVL
jgi:hypothetical protein